MSTCVSRPGREQKKRCRYQVGASRIYSLNYGKLKLSALQILLDDLITGSWPVPCNSSTPQFLTIDEDIVISIVEDDTRGCIELRTSPGYIASSEVQAESAPGAPWTTEAIDDDLCQDATRTLQIDPESGLVCLHECWPRAHLDCVRFKERLSYLADANRYWRTYLHARVDSDRI
jgi:hypothetical protein